MILLATETIEIFFRRCQGKLQLVTKYEALKFEHYKIDIFNDLTVIFCAYFLKEPALCDFIANKNKLANIRFSTCS